MKKLYILFVSSPFLLPFTQVKTVNSYENKTFLKENFNLKNNNSNLKEKFIVFANKYKKIPKYKNISLFNSKLNDNLKFNNVSSGFVDVFNLSTNYSFVLNYVDNNFLLGKDIEKNYSSLMSILPSQLNLDKKYNFLTSINNFNFVGNEKYNFAGTSESDNGQSLKVFHGDIKDGLLFNFYTTDYNATFQGLSWWKILLIVVGVIAAIIAIAFGFYNAASYFGWVGGEAAAAGAESAGASGAAGAAAGDAAGVLDRLEIYGREWLAARRDIDALGPTWANGSPWATGTAGGAAGAEGAVGGVSEGAAGGAMADAEGVAGGVSEGAAGDAMADAEGASGGASGGLSESAITGSEGETASGAGANEELEGISEEEAENNSSSFRDKLEEKGKDFFNDLKKGYKSGKKGFRSFRKGTSKFGKKIYKQGKNYFREKTGKTNKNDLENAVGKGGKNKPDYEPSTSGTSRQNVQSGGGNSNLNRGVSANNTGTRTYVYGENSDFSTPDNVTTHLSPGGSSDPYKFEWDPFQNH